MGGRARIYLLGALAACGACAPVIVSDDAGPDAGIADAGETAGPVDGDDGQACLEDRVCLGATSGCNLANMCVDCGVDGAPSVSSLTADEFGVCWTAEADFCDLVLTPSDGSGMASNTREIALDTCVPILISEPYDVSFKCFRGDCLVIERTTTGP